MIDKLVIRTSDRAEFKTCRQRWDFTSKIRMNYEPLRPKDYLEFGTAWHVAMEVWYEPGDGYQTPARERAAQAAFKQTTNDQQRTLEEFGYGGPDLDIEFDKRLALGKGMLNYYFGWARINDDFEPVTVEHEFEVPIETDSGWQYYYNTRENRIDGPFSERWHDYLLPVVYQGRIDGLVRDFAGNYWLLEHKTAERESGTYWLQMDSQVGSYIYVFQRLLDRPIKGCIYTRAYKRFPQPPKVLTDGSISCDKRQQTTASLFVEAVEQAHSFRPAAETIADTEKYLNYHQFLTNPDVAPKFVERFQPTRNPRQIEGIGQQIAMEAQDMLNDPFIYTNVTPINCNNCAFKGPCLTKQDGGDWEYHLASEYRKRDNG